MAIVLREVRSLDDIIFNFNLLANALSNITGEQIVGGSIGAGAISGDVVPRSGGSFTGPIAATEITSTGGVNGQTGTFVAGLFAASVSASGSVKSGGKDCVVNDKAASPGELGLVKQAAVVVSLAGAISDPPTQAEVTAIRNKVNEILNAERAAGQMAT
jgi:hypothetical protein